MMPGQPDLTVKNLNVSESPHAEGGQMTSKKVLTFFVGEHGPFTKTYVPKEAGTASAMKADITAQVSELQELHAHQPGGVS